MKNKPHPLSTKAIKKFQGALVSYGKSMDLALDLVARYDELQPPSTFMEFSAALRAGLVHVVVRDGLKSGESFCPADSKFYWGK